MLSGSIMGLQPLQALLPTPSSSRGQFNLGGRGSGDWPHAGGAESATPAWHPIPSSLRQTDCSESMSCGWRACRDLFLLGFRLFRGRRKAVYPLKTLWRFYRLDLGSGPRPRSAVFNVAWLNMLMRNIARKMRARGIETKVAD